VRKEAGRDFTRVRSVTKENLGVVQNGNSVSFPVSLIIREEKSNFVNACVEGVR
jgi:hypothetical protein